MVGSKTTSATGFLDSIDTSGTFALIRGTSIEAHRIVALLDGGMSLAEVLCDYPSLSKQQVSAAQAYGTAHPWTGRPFPPITSKSAIRGADLDRLDQFK